MRCKLFLCVLSLLSVMSFITIKSEDIAEESVSQNSLFPPLETNGSALRAEMENFLRTREQSSSAISASALSESHVIQSNILKAYFSGSQKEQAEQEEYYRFFQKYTLQLYRPAELVSFDSDQKTEAISGDQSSLNYFLKEQAGVLVPVYSSDAFQLVNVVHTWADRIGVFRPYIFLNETDELDITTIVPCDARPGALLFHKGMFSQFTDQEIEALVISQLVRLKIGNPVVQKVIADLRDASAVTLLSMALFGLVTYASGVFEAKPLFFSYIAINVLAGLGLGASFLIEKLITPKQVLQDAEVQKYLPDSTHMEGLLQKVNEIQSADLHAERAEAELLFDQLIRQASQVEDQERITQVERAQEETNRYYDQLEGMLGTYRDSLEKSKSFFALLAEAEQYKQPKFFKRKS